MNIEYWILMDFLCKEFVYRLRQRPPSINSKSQIYSFKPSQIQIVFWIIGTYFSSCWTNNDLTFGSHGGRGRETDLRKWQSGAGASLQLRLQNRHHDHPQENNYFFMYSLFWRLKDKKRVYFTVNFYFHMLMYFVLEEIFLLCSVPEHFMKGKK